MNKSLFLAIIALAAVVFAGLTWLKLRKQVSSDHSNTAIVPTENTSPAAIAPKVIVPAHSIPTNVTQNIHKALAERQDKLIQLGQAEILFYGRVIDETGVAIQGARAVASTDAADPSSQIEKISDANGAFSILTKRAAFSVAISKEGYQPLDTKNNHFDYGKYPSPASPNPDHPVIFVLKKR